MKKTTMLSLFAVLAVAVVSTAVMALPIGHKAQNNRNNEMRDALQSGDYEAYLEAYNDADRPYLKSKMTEEKFNARVEAHQEMEFFKEKVDTALDNADYEAWVSAMADAPVNPRGESPRGTNIADVITEDNFDTFIALHNARLAGDYEVSHELAQELGLPNFGPRTGQGHEYHSKGSGNGMGQDVNYGESSFGETHRGFGQRRTRI